MIGCQFQLGDPLDAPHLTPLFTSDILVLNIPPGRKNFAPEFYVRHMQVLMEKARQSGVDKLIFISTSAVYGESERTVFEYSELDPVTQSAQAHTQIEQYAQNLFGEHLCVMRLSGLIGPDRHPIRTLAGKSNLTNPHRRVNLVHLDDVIKALATVIEKQRYGHCFHLCAEEHPTRQEYYRFAAQSKSLTPPEFVEEEGNTSEGKILDCRFTLETLGIELSYPSPFDML